MAPKNPRLRMLAARKTRTVYKRHDRVVIWRSVFCGEEAFVVKLVGKKLHVRVFAPDERIRRLTKDKPVVVYKTPCCRYDEI